MMGKLRVIILSALISLLLATVTFFVSAVWRFDK